MVVPVPDRARARADPGRRPRAARAPRRLLGAPPGRVLRRDPCDARDSEGALAPSARAAAAGGGRPTCREPGRDDRGRSTRSASTTSSSSPPSRARGSRRGCARTATGSRRARPRCSGSYIKQGMNFFVGQGEPEGAGAASASRYLRPLQVAFESPKFMLPIRLGMVNAEGPQELFVFTLTRKGRVETTNYRTVRLPSGMDVPVYVKEEFGDFYKAMFADQVKTRGHARRCSSSTPGTWAGAIPAPPTRCRTRELRELGVFWLEESAGDRRTPDPPAGSRAPRPSSSRGSTCATTPRTSPRTWCSRRPATATNFQGRYVLRHPWNGERRLRGGRGEYRERPAERQRAGSRRRSPPSPAGTSTTSAGGWT